MTWILKHKVAAIIAAIIAYFLFRKVAQAANAPAVYEDVFSGHQFGTFDTNVLSPTFGEQIGSNTRDNF